MKIGVSGHQDLGSSDTVMWIKRQFLHQLGQTIFASGISSLAAGADQLFARTVLELRHPIEVIIPCKGYESTFENSPAKQSFEELKKRAATCDVLDFPRPSEEAFFAAGKLIVEISDLLFAVWDGQPAAGLGGTADIVKYALNRRKQVLHINPSTMTSRFLDNS